MRIQDSKSIEVFFPENKSTLIDLVDLNLFFSNRCYIPNGKNQALLIWNSKYHPPIKFHRAVMGDKPGTLIDHINRDALDNRRVNLRFSNKSLNALNSKPRTNNPKGVTFLKHTGKWCAQAMLNGKNFYLGSFKTIEEATQARKNWEIKYVIQLPK